ncbi:MAG: class I SAM-dependent methyltransferase [Flavobacteriales bacterium]|nr:class I SAM-dependent methyltransferase [Flavobacteriales bacterium]
MASPLQPDTSAYDREFTFSRIGMVQRRMVWGYLDTMLSMPGMNVLELNCGTGTDAVHLARNGHRVMATDISEEMLKVAREKARQFGVEDRIDHVRLGFEDLPLLATPPMDLVLSNFGGFNCIDAPHLSRLADPIANALKPGGRFIAVVMPDRCLAETVHYFFRGNWKEAFRRGRHDPVWAALSGTGAVTWYHSPRMMIDAFHDRFRVVNVRPIGLFVPPTFLENRIGHRGKFLERLARWDARTAGWRWTARYADHYLIDLERTR